MQKSEIIQSISDVLRRVLPSGSRALLFGSQARGTAHADSDWDILILMDKPHVNNDDYGKFAYPIVELGWKMGLAINPLLYTFDDWKKRHFTPFYKNVEREGIELWH